MTSSSLSPRLAAAVGMLAIVPAAWYGLASSGTAGIFATVNVILIIASVALAMSPTEDTGHHETTSA